MQSMLALPCCCWAQNKLDCVLVGHSFLKPSLSCFGKTFSKVRKFGGDAKARVWCVCVWEMRSVAGRWGLFSLLRM